MFREDQPLALGRTGRKLTQLGHITQFLQIVREGAWQAGQEDLF